MFFFNEVIPDNGNLNSWWIWFLLSFVFTVIIIRFIRAQKRRYVLEILEKNPRAIKNAGDKIKAALNRFENKIIEDYSKQLQKKKKSKKKENILINQTIEKLRNNFLDDLKNSQGKRYPALCDHDKISSLRKKWNTADKVEKDKNNNSNIFKGGNKKGQINSLKKELKDKEQELSEMQEKIAQEEKKLIEKEEIIQEIKSELVKATPYTAPMKQYFDLLKLIYDFSSEQIKRIPSSSIFYTFLETVLYVKGSSKTYNPIFNQIRKDEYLCSVFQKNDPKDLADIDKQTFFDFIIKGRGFSMLNSITKLYAYSKIPGYKLNTADRMREDGLDLKNLDTLFELMNEMLKENFDVAILLPRILEDKYQSELYDKNNFSYLAEHYSFSDVEDDLIYDVERIGFKSTKGIKEQFSRPIVTYKIS